MSGTASYRGIAAGFYASQYGTDGGFGIPRGTQEVGEFDGTAALTANFGASTIQGRISNIEAAGVIVYPNGTAEAFEAASDYEIRLAPTRIGSDGRFSGAGVTVWHPHLAVRSQGSWGGRFSTIDDSAGDPRLVAGTLGATATTPGGSVGSFVGGFYGVTPQFR